jgi:SsrA-binding protein
MNKEVLNKGALRSFEVVKKYTAGVKLTGAEAKSLRLGGGNLKGSYVSVKGKEPFLVGFNIPKYKKASVEEYDPKRPRKLLLNKTEIRDIKVGISDKGRTVVPLKVFLKDHLFKVEIAVAKGLTKSGQKQKLKEKQQQRETERQVKEYNR